MSKSIINVSFYSPYLIANGVKVCQSLYLQRNDRCYRFVHRQTDINYLGKCWYALYNTFQSAITVYRQIGHHIYFSQCSKSNLLVLPPLDPVWTDPSTLLKATKKLFDNWRIMLLSALSLCQIIVSSVPMLILYYLHLQCISATSYVLYLQSQAKWTTLYFGLIMLFVLYFFQGVCFIKEPKSNTSHDSVATCDLCDPRILYSMNHNLWHSIIYNMEITLGCQGILCISNA
jgi:hypothetical protein